MRDTQGKDEGDLTYSPVIKISGSIGSFGKGNGKRQTWGFYEDGELKLTHGTPANMPMTRAVTTVCNEIEGLFFVEYPACSSPAP